MALQSLGPESGRKLLYGVVLPAVVVGALLGVALAAPAIGFLALMAATIGGAVLYMAIANDMRAQNYANRSTMSGSSGVGIQATDVTDEKNPEMGRLTGTLQLVSAGLGAAGLLGLVAFAVLV
jgi:hypothetical protein